MRFSDGSNEFEVAVQSWRFSSTTLHETSIYGMQHSLWYQRKNIKNVDIVLEGHTIIWEFQIPEKSEVAHDEMPMIPEFDYSNAHIVSCYEVLDGNRKSY